MWADTPKSEGARRAGFWGALSGGGTEDACVTHVMGKLASGNLWIRGYNDLYKFAQIIVNTAKENTPQGHLAKLSS